VEIIALADRLATVGWPRWTPSQYGAFVALAAELVGQGICETSPLSAGLRDEMNAMVEKGQLAADEMVSRKNVSVLLTNLLYQGAQFGENCNSRDEFKSLLLASVCKNFETRLGPPSDVDLAYLRTLVTSKVETQRQPEPA
jgi:hypothetical protein